MNDTVNTTVESTIAAPVALSKEQRVAKLREQMAKIEARIVAIETGVEVKVAKVVALPEVGATVSFTYGRRTATTEPTTKVGIVIAVKSGADVAGKKLPAQVKVQIGEGFDTEFVTIYPAQIVAAVEQDVSAE